MNRRDFFQRLTAGAVTLSTGGIALLAQELVEPSKTFFLPPVGGWVTGGNTLLTYSQIVNEALCVLHREMVFNTTAADYAGAMTKLNQMIAVRKPQRYIVSVENKDWYGNAVKA